MNKKKLLAVGLSVALVATAIISGTYAYLTDTDEDVNVMTLGNVDIEQNEQEREDDNEGQSTLVDFEQKKPLFPAVYPGDSIPSAPENEWVVPGDSAWEVLEDNENVVDKFVTVTNTGKSDAYVRTIIAYEGNPFDENEIHILTNGEPEITCDIVRDVVIDGVNYTIAVYTYSEALAAGETTIPSLKQIYMDKACDNEEVAKYGETYNILVFSQAVQTEGFDDAATALDTAFGEVTAENHPWSADAWDGTADTSWYDASADEYVLDSAEDVAGFAAIVNGGNGLSGKTIKLDTNVSLAGYEWTPIGQTGTSYGAKTYFQGVFDGQGHTISAMTIKNTNDGEHYAAGFFGFIDMADAVIKNVNFSNATVNGHHWTGVVAGYITGEISGCTVRNSSVTCTHANGEACGDKAGVIVGYVNQGTVTGNTVIDCEIAAGRDAGVIAGAAKTTQVYDNTFSGTTVEATGDCEKEANINTAEIGRVL